MIAYNKTWLHNLFVNEQAAEVFEENCISKTEKEAIDINHTDRFYTPNLFIRIGLFLLTCIAASFVVGFFTLLFLNGIEQNFFVVLILVGIAAFVGLNFFIKKQQHYKSGVDDALIWIVASCLIFIPETISNVHFNILQNTVLAFVISTILFIRYADMLLASISLLCLNVILIILYYPISNFTKANFPLLLLFINVLIYFLLKKYCNKNKFSAYRHVIESLEITNLICIYASINFFVLQEIKDYFFINYAVSKVNFSLLNMVCWVGTVFIPLLYLYKGIKQKNILQIRVGLVLIAAMVFTVRYFYSVLPLEIAMILGGIILIIASYFLGKYFSNSKFGFTSLQKSNSKKLSIANLESLIIAETFGHSNTSQEQTTIFGGGSGDGGGASGSY